VVEEGKKDRSASFLRTIKDIKKPVCHLKDILKKWTPHEHCLRSLHKKPSLSQLFRTTLAFGQGAPRTQTYLSDRPQSNGIIFRHRMDSQQVEQRWMDDVDEGVFEQNIPAQKKSPVESSQKQLRTQARKGFRILGAFSPYKTVVVGDQTDRCLFTCLQLHRTLFLGDGFAACSRYTV
jgi:hypothetical protein